MSIGNGVVTEEPGKIRFHKRGPRAWDNFFEMPAAGLLQGGTTRLLVHSVADATTKQWLPKARSFLEHLQAKQIIIEMPGGIDKELAEYMDHLCYGLQKSPSIGALLFFGLLCLAPELKGRLPLSARSLKAWGKLAISCEGGPLPEEIVYLIAVEMVRKGFLYQGAWVLCQYDVYGREQDMEQLDTSDISYDGQHMGSGLRRSSSRTERQQRAQPRSSSEERTCDRHLLGSAGGREGKQSVPDRSTGAAKNMAPDTTRLEAGVRRPSAFNPPQRSL